MRVTLYLLRERAKLAKETLRKHHLYDERQLRPPETSDVEWRCYVRTGIDRDASWFEHVSPILAAGAAEPVKTKTAGAVLLVRAHGRLFAVTFGVGFHAVDPALTESDFGLRVTANCIDEDRLTLADARGLGKGKRNATSRLSLPGRVFALGLLTDEEWIRKFGGEVRVTGFAKNASGADALQLNIEDFSLFNLPVKLRQALDLYQATTYQEYFPFLDYFRRVTDKEAVKELDTLLTAAMQDRDLEVGFASPDEFNLHADTYQLSRYGKAVQLAELRTEDVYNAIDELNGWRNPLQAVKIEAFDLAGESVRDREPLRPYVIGSVQRSVKGHHQDYAVTAGAWFRIDQAYVDLVDRYIRDYVTDITTDLRLPEWDDDYLNQHVDGKYAEDRYNRWVSGERGYALLDLDFYRKPVGAQIEICDLLTKDKQLICVKRMDGSDKMSHLFQQGSVSAQLIMTNEDYRAKLMDKLHELDPNAEFGSPTDWTVVYAIATSKPGPLKEIMYFFSRAALRIHALSIRQSGIKVAIAKIDRKP
jgi:uncharacterized protein (TIGR04141 family)